MVQSDLSDLQLRLHQLDLLSLSLQSVRSSRLLLLVLLSPLLRLDLSHPLDLLVQ